MTHHDQPHDQDAGMHLVRRMNALMDELEAMTQEAGGWRSNIDPDRSADWHHRKAELLADIEAYERHRH